MDIVSIESIVIAFGPQSKELYFITAINIFFSKKKRNQWYFIWTEKKFNNIKKHSD